MSEILDAAYNLVHDHPGGAASLAPRLGKNSATLSHEVKHCGFAKLGLVDAAKLTDLTGDLRILNAFAASANCLVLPMPHQPECDNEGTMRRVAALAKEFSDVVWVVSDAAADSRITANEIKAIDKAWGELVACGQALVAHLHAQHGAGVPGHARGAA